MNSAAKQADKHADATEVFNMLYDDHVNTVFKIAYSYLKSRDKAEDVVQEVFSTIWQRRTQLDTISNLKAYLIILSRNQTFLELKRVAREYSLEEIFPASTTDNPDIPEEGPDWEKRYNALANAVDLLPPQQKKVFEMGKFQYLSHDTIAKELNISEGTVKNHMTRALHFLRNHLSENTISLLIALLAY